MGVVCCIGLDIAKQYFQIHGVDKHGGGHVQQKAAKCRTALFREFAYMPCRN